MFNLENEIRKWLKRFRKYQAFNHGSIREMEIHLRDHIEDLMAQGHDEKRAFTIAVASFGEIGDMAREEYLNLKTKSRFNFLTNNAMFGNNIKMAVRNFQKHKFYALINVIGLTMGLAIVFMIGLFIVDELSFDNFHTKKNQLYRVVENQYYVGQPVFPVAVTPTALGPSLAESFPEIKNYTRVSYENMRFEVGDTNIMEKDGIMVDAAFFDMFSFPILKGNVSAFKDQLNALILTEALAEKYFSGQEPIGKMLKLEGKMFEVVAVMQDVPKNSHLSFRYLFNFEHYLAEDAERANSWGSNWLYTYVALDEGANLEAVNDKIIGQIKANNESSVTDIYLQPLTDIYLGKIDFTVEVSRKGEMMYLQVFSIVAGFILLISCINFMNLTTARSSKRVKEIGLRKTVGANRKQLMIQFLFESVFLTLVAVFLSICLMTLLLPAFNQLANKNFSILMLAEPNVGIQLLMGVVIVAVLTGLIAGSYPAIYLSSIKPISSLNEKVVKGKKGAGFRKALVVLQFVVSVVLIIGTIVVYQQLQYIQNADLGYNRDNIIYTFIPGNQSETFANELRKQHEVIKVGLSNRHPAYILSSSSGVQWPGQDENETFLFHYMGVDEYYISTMEMKVVEGRSFKNSDSTVVLINQKAKAIMGMKDPIGQTIDARGAYNIVGVVEDFNFKSIHTAIEPIIIFKGNDLNRVFIKYTQGKEDHIIATLATVWDKHFPDRELDYYFLDDDFDKLYDAEQRTSTLSTYFAGLAIFISCLGLFGLVSYATEQRTKEIGIRKALGASVRSLFLLLTGDFTRIVFISLIIAIPIGWFAMEKWLESFAYHIDVSIWVYIFSAIMALTIAVLTVSYESIIAALSNPVKSLRKE